MNALNSIKNRKVLSVSEIEEILEKSTIFDKIEFSGITKSAIRNKITDLENRQVPERTVLLKMTDSAVVEYWFKNWLHPMLKHAVNQSPTDKRGCSERVLNNDLKQDSLRFYENGQQNFNYTIDDIKLWLNPDIYEEMKKAGVKISNHCSDLYVPVNKTSTEILNRPEFEINKRNSTRFISNINGTPHYDIPFEFSPYWEK